VKNSEQNFLRLHVATSNEKPEDIGHFLIAELISARSKMS